MGRRRASKNRGRASRRGRRSQRRSRRRTTTGDGAPATDGTDGWVRHSTALPSWTDLETKNRRRRPDGESFLENVSTVRFSLLVLAIAGAFTLYVGHVHATTDLLNQLQEVRAENRRLHLKHNRLQGEYDRRTGPSVIYERAREMGLRASVSYGRPISIEDD